MKIKRYKKVNKFLQYYCNHFGFHKPYQVLIDGTFCFGALKYHINIEEQLKKYLDGDVKLLTTKCIVIEVEKLGRNLHGTSIIAKQFGIHECGHNKKSVSGAECIRSMTENNHESSRYIIATQDRDLQNYCRSQIAVPLIYLHTNTPTLEQPSQVSKTFTSQKTNNSLSMRQFEKETLEKTQTGVNVEGSAKKRKRKGGPNPLSCKKKKNSGETKCDVIKNSKKQKRKRNSVLVKRIKKEILSQQKL